MAGIGAHQPLLRTMTSLGSSPGAGQGAGADPLVEAAEHLPLDERRTRRSESLPTRAEPANMAD